MIRVLKYFDGKDIQEIKLAKDRLTIDKDGSLNIYHGGDLVKTIVTTNYTIDYKGDQKKEVTDYLKSDGFSF